MKRIYPSVADSKEKNEYLSKSLLKIAKSRIQFDRRKYFRDYYRIFAQEIKIKRALK